MFGNPPLSEKRTVTGMDVPLKIAALLRAPSDVQPLKLPWTTVPFE
jgi:hypothetical protein